ncbi:MAG TPA: hypothetical protein PKZ84_06695 [Anaerolineae bacterium]|nr:hypothetical protein [Anaerolineae bacterium]HQI83375.1 hypothetical protein [Anaerolineae bacterium]
MKRQHNKLKRTSYILLAVGVIFGGILLAGGVQLYRWLTAPRIDLEATPIPTATATLPPTATPIPTGWLEQHDTGGKRVYLTPPIAEEQALRRAFIVLLQRTRVLDAEALLAAYDRDASIAQARDYVAADYAWSLLDTQFVFVHSALGPENPIRCDDTTHCQLTQAVLGIQAVLIFDPAMCQSLGRVPCLAQLGDDQIDARDNLVTAMFRLSPDGVWRLTGWEATALPAPPETW